MIVNTLLYQRDLSYLNKLPHTTEVGGDLRFLLEKYKSHLTSRYNCLVKGLKQTDPSFEERLLKGKITKIVAVDKPDHNTLATIQLPDDKARIRGNIDIHYDRIDLKEYFNIDEMILSHRRHKEMVISYERWVKAAKSGKGALTTLIHRVLGYKFGKTFSYDGQMIFEDGAKRHLVTGTKPLALIIPTLDQLEGGWKHLANVEGEVDDGKDYQMLNIHLRLVSSHHAFIKDGEVLIQIQLRYPLQSFKRLKEGNVYHD